MSTLTAILIFAAWPCLHAADELQPTLRAILGDEYSPIQRLVTCSQALGPTKCLSALSVWRAERAIEAYAINPKAQFSLREDVERFPWIKYSNASEEQLYTRLFDDTARLLQYRSLMFNVIPGYELHLESKGNGTMNVDVFKGGSEQSGRGMMKKLHKKFYKIMPLIALPGLIMAAILPFLLPGLKMITLATVMLNNMALVGAVFTLLRNNAFNDKYEHKVLYVNKGYKNEKDVNEEHIHTDHAGVFYSDGKPISDNINHLAGHHAYGDDFDSIDEIPAFTLNHDWVQHSDTSEIPAMPINHQWMQKKRDQPMS